MSRLTRHVLVPGLASVAVLALAATPVSVIGCANRGIAALIIVIAALLVGIGAAIQAVRLRARDPRGSSWWAISAAILAVPALLVLGPLR